MQNTENTTDWTTGTLPDDTASEWVTGTLPDDTASEWTTGTIPDDTASEWTTGTIPDDITSNWTTDTLTDDIPSSNSKSLYDNNVTDSRREANVREREKNVRQQRKNVNLLEGNKSTYTVLSRVNSDVNPSGQSYIFNVRDNVTNEEFIAKMYALGRESKYSDEITKLMSSNNVKGLIHIIDYGTNGGRKFYIMKKLVPFDAIRDRLILDDAKINNIVRTLNEAVNFLHANNLIHSDIKTDNIMYDVENDLPTLIDYGSITKGEYTEQVLSSTTTTAYKISEGYTPPELYLHSASAPNKIKDRSGNNIFNPEKGKMVISNASDYYQLGICFCEMFRTSTNKDKNGIDLATPFKYRLFMSNAEAVAQVSTHNIMLPDDINSNKRISNLINSLIQYDPRDRAGYDDINIWLTGRLIPIKQKYNLHHYFCKNDYYRTDDLAEALATHWEDAAVDIYRGQLEKDFEECKDKKRYTELQNLRIKYAQSEKTNEDLDSLIFESVCIVDPSIDFFWKGKIYHTVNGENTDLSRDLCAYVDNNDNIFDSLFRKNLLRTFYETKGIYNTDISDDDLKRKNTIERIVTVGTIYPKIAALLFADAQKQGTLAMRITSGAKTLKEYFTDIYTLFENNGFDKIVKYYLGEDEHKDPLCEFIENIIKSPNINTLFIKMNLNYLNFKEADLHSDQLFRIILNVFEHIGRLIGKNNACEIITKSATYTALNAIAKNYKDYKYIDVSGIEAESVRKEYENVSNLWKKTEQKFNNSVYATNKDNINTLASLLVSSYRLWERLNINNADSILIYETSFIQSNMQIPFDSYIFPKSQNGELYIVNDKYILPKRSVDSLLNSGFSIKYKKLKDRNEIYEYIVDANNSVLDSFISNYEVLTNTNSETYLDRWGVISLYFELVLVILTGLITCLLLATIVFNIMNLSKREISGIHIYTVILTLILGFRFCVSTSLSKDRIIKMVENLKTYNKAKKTIKHYSKLMTAYNELSVRKSKVITKPLSKYTSSVLVYATKTNNNYQNVSKYIADNNISSIDSSFYEMGKKILIKNLILSAILSLYTLLPVNLLTQSLLIKDINIAYEITEDAVQNSVISIVNSPLSRLSLKLTESGCVNMLYKKYNNSNYEVTDTIQECQKYYALFDAYNGHMDDVNESKLNKMALSRTVSDNYLKKDADELSIEDLKYMFQVVPNDKNYDTIQRLIEEYMHPINYALQNGIDYQNEFLIESAQSQYRDIVDNAGGNSEIKEILDILENNDGDERAILLIANQLNKLVSQRNQAKYQVYKISSIKKKDGLYFVDLGVENKNFHIVTGTYRNETYALNTYSYMTYSSREEDPDIREALDGINSQDYSDYINCDESWNINDYANSLFSAGEYIDPNN